MARVLALTLLAGCTHLSTLDGAVPLAPGASAYTAQLQVAREPGPVTTPLAIPLPSFSLHLRRGLWPDADGGIHVYPDGFGVDVRQRFWHADRWHLAAQPGVVVFVAPIPSVQWGVLDVSLPVRAERELGAGWSLAGGPGVVARQTFLHADTGGLEASIATFELYGGGGVRAQKSWKRVRLGVSGDLYVDTTRATGLYGGLGLDFGVVRPPRSPAAAVRAPGGVLPSGGPT